MPRESALIWLPGFALIETDSDPYTALLPPPLSVIGAQKTLLLPRTHSEPSEPHASLPPRLLDSGGELRWLNSALDASQQAAVRFALQQRELAIIHGPPGDTLLKLGRFPIIFVMQIRVVVMQSRIIVNLRSESGPSL
jgi:hypothetical protein